MSHLVSILMAAYNAEEYIADAIDSVIGQSWKQWEFLIINDGSIDNTKEIILSYNDPRIRYFEQSNQGVSAARNIGLTNMRGDYFCFLDADDILPGASVEARLNMFIKNPKLAFVDGIVCRFAENVIKQTKLWKPSHSGNPFKDLITFGGQSFAGLTWLIKRKKGKHYAMESGLSHGEDLLFFMEQSRNGELYDFVDELILFYRDNPDSAMKNLKELEISYNKIYKHLKSWKEVPFSLLVIFKYKTKKIMFLSFMKLQNDFNEAIRSLFRS